MTWLALAVCIVAVTTYVFVADPWIERRTRERSQGARLVAEVEEWLRSQKAGA